jgi:hypothetical protein
LKFDKAVAQTSLPYGSESWTIKARYINRLKLVEMRYLRIVKGCTTLHHFKNVDIRKEMKIQSAQNKTDEYI